MKERALKVGQPSQEQSSLSATIPLSFARKRPAQDFSKDSEDPWEQELYSGIDFDAGAPTAALALALIPEDTSR